MSDLEVIDHEELTSAPVTLFRTDDPDIVLQRATATADALVRVVRDPKRKLISTISGREFPLVECWTLLGTLVGVFPVCIWSRPVTVGEETGWEARVEAHTRDGAIVGAAEAMCMRSERNWSKRDEYALRSMAQTRATSKALRLPLGFVMTLAGLEATPAEEMPQEATGATERPRSGSGRAAAPPKAENGSEGVQLVSDPQKRKIGVLLRERQVDEGVYRAKLATFNVEHTKDLTVPQASALIKWLTELTTVAT